MIQLSISIWIGNVENVWPQCCRCLLCCHSLPPLLLVVIAVATPALTVITYTAHACTQNKNNKNVRNKWLNFSHCYANSASQQRGSAKRQAICQIFNDYPQIRKLVPLIANFCYFSCFTPAIYAHTTTYGSRTPTVQCQLLNTRWICAAQDYRNRIHSYMRAHIQDAAKSSHLLSPAIILIHLRAHEELLCFCKLWGSKRRNNHRHHFPWTYKYRWSFVLFALQNANTKYVQWDNYCRCFFFFLLLLLFTKAVNWGCLSQTAWACDLHGTKCCFGSQSWLKVSLVWVILAISHTI